MNNALKSGFPPFVDEQSLRSAIESVCAQFGRVIYLRIHSATRAPESGLHCACFLRLEPAEAAIKLKSRLDVIYFCPEIAFFADVDENWAGSATSSCLIDVRADHAADDEAGDGTRRQRPTNHNSNR